MLEVAITAFEQVLAFEQGLQTVTDATHIVAGHDKETAVSEPILSPE